MLVHKMNLVLAYVKFCFDQFHFLLRFCLKPFFSFNISLNFSFGMILVLVQLPVID